MNSLSDKPGVLGVVGSLGNAVKQGATNEVKKTVKNTLEQLDLGGAKENKEKLVETGAPVGPTPDELKKQSQEAVNWLYGTSSTESVTPPPAPKVEGQADLKQQLGIELKNPNTANAAEQFGIKKDQPHTTANPLEQVGLGQSNQVTASATEQLNFNPAPALTPEEAQKQQQLKSQLHNEYYQRLTNPQKAPDTQERQKEAQEEQETAQQRMDRLHQEDLQKKKEDDEKKQPIAVDQAQNAEKNRGAMG
jgi:predicted transcriptional regulator